jgi:predicted aspartyl protease
VTWGPTLQVDIGFDPNHDAKLAVSPPVAGVSGLHALVDTGATESCIDSLLAAQLNLPVVDRHLVAGVGGSHEVNVHLAQVHIPALNVTINGAFAGVQLRAGGQLHSALIGRTFLMNFKMVYDGPKGQVELIRIT